MKDLDFDELDKAISSVLEPDKPAQSTASTSIRVAVGGPSADSQAAAETPTYSTPVVEKPTDAAMPIRPIVSPRRSINRGTVGSSGRPLVDVMAPGKPQLKSASRVAPTVAPETVAKAVKLESTGSIDPAASLNNDDIILSKLVDVEATPSSDESPAVEQASSAPSSASAFGSEGFGRFDSLSKSGISFDVPAADQVIESPPKTEAEQATHPLAGLNDVVADDSEQDALPGIQPTSQPVNEQVAASASPTSVSPFLEDAFVEKRPLGSLRGQTETNADSSVEPTLETDATEHADIDHRLPEHGTEDDSIQSPPVLQHTAAAGAASLGATSIAQQYKVDAQRPPSPGSHAPFDTSEYHSAIAAEATSKHTSHGDKTMLVAIIILVVAIVLAAVIYFYGSHLQSIVP